MYAAVAVQLHIWGRLSMKTCLSKALLMGKVSGDVAPLELEGRVAAGGELALIIPWYLLHPAQATSEPGKRAEDPKEATRRNPKSRRWSE